jgi:hypothetical protein
MKKAGRSFRISPRRRLVTDLMHFSSKVPRVTVERRMELGRLLLARQACKRRPSWCAVFTKAFATVAARRPELRQSYMSLPWPRIYEHPRNMATLNVDRQFGNERIVIYAHVRSPENRSLTELDALVRYHKEEPLENIKSFSRSMKLARLPFPLRRLVWWLGLNLFGRRRSHNFGTFGLTSTAVYGAGILTLVPVLTSTIHYGLFDSRGSLDMRLSFDHRVLDGATAAQSLVDMEHVLLHQILDEVRSLNTVNTAAKAA